MVDKYNAMEEKLVEDSNTKEIDLINRDPKQINEDVVRVGGTSVPLNASEGAVCFKSMHAVGL